MANVGDSVWYASARDGLLPGGEPRTGMVLQVYADGEVLLRDSLTNQLVKVWSEHTGPTREWVALKIARDRATWEAAPSRMLDTSGERQLSLF